MSAIGPGDLVECVEEIDRGGTYGDEAFPTVGGVYTVRGILTIGEHSGLLLEEIRNEPRDYSNGVHELAFYHRRFRPVRRDELQIFRDIVAKPKVDA